MELALASLDRDDGPTRAGATLFIGAFGEQSQKEEVAKNFSELHTFMGQRAALLAIQEVPFKQLYRTMLPERSGMTFQMFIEMPSKSNWVTLVIQNQCH